MEVKIIVRVFLALSSMLPWKRNENLWRIFFQEIILIYSFGKASEETKGEIIQKGFWSSAISLIKKKKNRGSL